MMVVRPLPSIRDLLRELGTKAQLMDFMAHGVHLVFGQT